MDSTGFMTCALKVDTQTGGWHKSLIKVLKKIDGVTYSIDAQQGVAYISGRVDPGKLLKLLAKSGKHAELCWVDSGNHNARIPNNKIHYNGYNYPYYNNQYGAYHEYYPYRTGDHYFDDLHDQQKSWYSYPELPEPYPLVANVPFYEPRPRYFPQSPKPMEGFNIGEAQLCSIM